MTQNAGPGGLAWDMECIARNPSTRRNCPYSLYCAVCDLDDEAPIDSSGSEP